AAKSPNEKVVGADKSDNSDASKSDKHADGEHGEHAGKGEHAEEHAHGGHGEEHAHGAGGEPLGHRFEDADKWAKRFDKKGRKSWQMPKEVIARMKITKGMRVADIGAGTGYFLPHLSAAVGEKGSVVGLDIEKDMVRYMRERAKKEKLGNVTAEISATDDPGLAPSSLDRVLIVNTWHHIADRVGYAKKLAKGLAEGGTVTIVDFTMEAKHGPKKSHRLLPDSIVKELKAAGLSAEIITEKLPDQYIVVGSK
ncbi:MAG: methyltransferase domain-containing protein, partial [Kofleriaceae bacterium]|nr:methyltransferase domain-containing protein [Kofleriaceae bacterium]